MPPITAPRRGGFSEDVPQYDNWITPRTMKLVYQNLAIVVFLTVLVSLFRPYPVLSTVLVIFMIGDMLVVVYLQSCRSILDSQKGNFLGTIDQFIVDHLPWTGQGTLLDIGCGAGALSIRCAKIFRNAQVTGVGFWESESEYGKKRCEANALTERVAERARFQQGSMPRLDFPDETFDAVVGSFMIHRASGQIEDGRDLVLEAIRVAKPGAPFAFVDLFERKGVFGDMDQLVSKLKALGVREVHYLPHVEKREWVPKLLRTFFLFKGMGLLYGVK